MSWLARLSFAQAVRWALLWPGVVLLLAAAGVGLAALAYWRGNWALVFGFESTGIVPVWVAVVVAIGTVLFAPSLAFLALWRVARR